MKKSVLMGALLICIAPSVFGQKKSAYETKKIAIENKYLQQMGVPLSDITQLRKKGDFFINALFAEKLSLYGKNKGTAQQMALLSKMADELKAAEKLKTTAEIKAEKDKKQQVEEKKEAEKLQREKLSKELEEREKMEKQEAIIKAQDINYIKNETKESFLEWAKKGEFESSKEHNERIQNEKIKKLHQEIATHFINNERQIYINLGTYNADDKIYPITIINHFPEVSIESNIPFEKEEAIELNMAIGNRDYVFPIDPDDWFLKDGFLFPINIEIYYNESKSKKISDKGNNPLFSEYVFNTHELGLSEYFPENYVFTLDKNIFKEIMEKKEY